MPFYHKDCYAGDTDFPSFITEFLLNYKCTYARKFWSHFFDQDSFVLCTRKMCWPQKCEVGWVQGLVFFTLKTEGTL